MFLLTIFVAGGVAYATITVLPNIGMMIGVVVFAFAAILAVSLILGAFTWFNDQTGVNAFLVHSWQFLSGVSNPSEVIESNGSSCVGEMTGFGEISLWFLGMAGLWILVLANIPIGLIAFIGMPLGLLGCAFSAISSLIYRDRERLLFSLQCLLVPLGFVILAGVNMRLIHVLNQMVQNLGC